MASTQKQAVKRPSARIGTKEKIYLVVRAKMAHSEVSQITVQDIMSTLNMRRQSFYYHFVDIYDVLEWSVSEHFCKKLTAMSADSFENWLRHALTVLHDNQEYIRQVCDSVSYERMSEMMYPVIEPKVRQLLSQKYQGADNLATLSHLMTYCVTSSFYTLILRKSPVDVEHLIVYVREAVHALGLEI